MENDKVIFQVIEGGPLKISGPVRIKGTDGKIIRPKETVFLCRCGHSTDKPFCSGAHKGVGFSE